MLLLCTRAVHAHMLVRSPPLPMLRAHTDGRSRSCVAQEPLVSPFESTTSSAGPVTGPLPLTLENVELVLDEMRPYLMADGGNVAVAEIADGIVRLELQGACGTCPSSTMTMKMGLERGLREKIPEIVEVEQVAPDGPQLTEEGVEGVLEEIRPFLKMAGGSVDLVSLEATGVLPTACLSITGSGATINSVRVEIAQRLKRNFPSLANVTWD
uniref:NIF system FeS cluster assembly NifU C-terminal domain-containing protein n=1 Tax=Coccolithus braarudii TaxID=221442 RepID=A0A7S0LHP7_9EUKA